MARVDAKLKIPDDNDAPEEAVDISAMSANNKTWHLPAGSGRIVLEFSGNDSAVSDPDDEGFSSVYTIDLSSTKRNVPVPPRNADFARIRRINGTSSGITTMLVGETDESDSVVQSIKCELRDVASTKRHVLDVLDGPIVVGSGYFVCGEDGVTADGTDYSVWTIAAYDASGASLGTIGTITLNATKTAHQRVAVALGAYLSLPANATITAKRANTGAGATIGVGAFIVLS